MNNTRKHALPANEKRESPLPIFPAVLVCDLGGILEQVFTAHRICEILMKTLFLT
jgi:hypothetical protein